MSFFDLQVKESVGWVYLDNARKRNFMDGRFWDGLPAAIEEMNRNEQVKVIVIAAHGSSFSMGLDILEFSEQLSFLEKENAQSRAKLYELILHMQKGFDVLENSPKPSIAAVQRHCIGGGLDLIAACDIRHCSEDAIFSLREVKVGIVADMGSLQRLPYIVGEAVTRELALTGRDFNAAEAKSMGLVSNVWPDTETLHKKVHETAMDIASNDPEVLRGIRLMLAKGRLLPRKDALEGGALYNAGFLQNPMFLELLEKMKNRKKNT